jgi:hypothetical protein
MLYAWFVAILHKDILSKDIKNIYFAVVEGQK